jgi:predicted Zn-dependent protease
VWFGSDRDPDEIATNAAYALIQRKLADKQLGRVETLELADFRALLETVFEVERLNRLVARGYVVEDRFAGLLSRIEALSQKTPDWPELTYLIASIADGAGNHAKAIVCYRKLQTPQVERTADPKIVRWAAQRLAELGQVAEAVDAEAQERSVSAARDFARLMGLEGPESAVAFVES